MLTEIQREHLELVRTHAEGILWPRDVLADAKNPNSPLHELFQWDDTTAADAYRLIQAKQVVKVAARLLPRQVQVPQRVVVSTSPTPKAEATPFSRVSTIPEMSKEESYVHSCISLAIAAIKIEVATREINIQRNTVSNETHRLGMAADFFIRGVPTHFILALMNDVYDDCEEWKLDELVTALRKQGVFRPPRWNEELACIEYEADKNYDEFSVYGLPNFEWMTPPEESC